MPSEIDYARLAAFIDGEGTIAIARRNREDRPSHSYYLRIDIGNTERILTDWLKSVFGGNVYQCKRKKARKLFYTWAIHSYKVVDILNHTLPYLIIKIEQAELGLEFQEYCVRKPPWTIVPHWLNELREGYFEEMKRLHH